MFHTLSTAALGFTQEITRARLPKPWFAFSAMTSCSIACRARLFRGVALPLRLPSLATLGILFCAKTFNFPSFHQARRLIFSVLICCDFMVK